MRFLFVDANYPGFLASLYRGAPELRMESYERQMTAIRDGLFGEAQFQAAALRELGHEAKVVITNAHSAQAAWAREHYIAVQTHDRSWTLRGRRDVIPSASGRSMETKWDIVLAQAREYSPDVLYMEMMDSIPPDFARQLVSLARFSLAQIAAPIPAGAFRDYGLLVSSIPSFVEQFQAAGANAMLVPLAFEPSVLGLVGPHHRDVKVSFVGSVGAAHPQRTNVLKRVADDVDLNVWAEDGSDLARCNSVTLHPPAFGRPMYEVLARSRVTLNAHAPWAGLDANNLRLFEATGMGALLLTDARRNLAQLFDVGREVVAFEDPADAARLARYYLDHPYEASLIAAAGQARTLRDHSWLDRMARVMAAVETRI